MENKFTENFWKMCQTLGVIKQLIEAGYMLDETILSQTGAEEILKSEKNQPDLDWVEDFRNLFSVQNIGVAGKKGDRFSVNNKLKRFIIQFGYSPEVILKATKNYLEQVDNMKYCFKAGNFIFKRPDGVKLEEHSELAAWCDEVDVEKEEWGETL